MKYNLRAIVPILLVVAVVMAFLQITYNYDNKYTTKGLPSQGGIVTLRSEDLEKNRLLFLVDDWFFCSGDVGSWSNESAKSTYIGEFSNYKKPARDGRALGTGTYRMFMDYKGDDKIASIYLPELFTEYTLWLDENPVASGSGSLEEEFLLSEGIHVLTLTVSANHGYYAGMYYPGAVGSSQAMGIMFRVKAFLYGAAFLIPLTLALFCFTLWRRDSKGYYRKFALLCLSFGVYVSYYLVQWWGLPWAEYWYLVEDLAFYGFLYFAVTMSIDGSAKAGLPVGRAAKWAAVIFPACEILLYIMTLKFDWAVALHGTLQDVYRLVIFCCLIMTSAEVLKKQSKQNLLILAANGVLGIGILSNLIGSNGYEPIYGLWQFEWCGLLLVGLFGYFMVLENKRIIEENLKYQTELEAMVAKRTEQLKYVLEERRAFFSDMAHELKAPIFATKAFIGMIRRHSVGLDPQFLFYLDQVEKKQKEMSKRVMSLNELNAVDKCDAPFQRIKVSELLEEVYRSFNPEAVVSGIHLIISAAAGEEFVYAQKGKLMVIFENLIYNGLRFTPPEGSITISADLAEAETEAEAGGSTAAKKMIKFTVKDTGCGISQEELPKVFNRFFIGKMKKGSGSGLGLYIVKTIAEEFSGAVSASSVVGEGSEFTVMLPACE